MTDETTIAEEPVEALVSWLIDEANMSPQEIAEALDNRVSSRTIYRWGKGESQPGNKSDHEELVALVRRVKETK